MHIFMLYVGVRVIGPWVYGIQIPIDLLSLTINNSDRSETLAAEGLARLTDSAKIVQTSKPAIF